MAEEQDGISPSASTAAAARRLVIKTGLRSVLWFALAWAAAQAWPGARWPWVVAFAFVAIGLGFASWMWLLARKLQRLEAAASDGESGPEQDWDPEQFIYLRIPDDIGPAERGVRFEEPIDEALGVADLGHVSGGGSLLGQERPDGSRPIEHCGIDVDTLDRDRALEVLRGLLPGLGCPPGTDLEYTSQGQTLRDRYVSPLWVIGEARTELHPGLEV